MSFLGKGAGVDSSTLETTDAHLKVNVGDKRERSNQVAIDDNVAATSSTDRHVPDSPSEGASKRLKGVVDALQGRARLWLACPEGLFPARDGPAVLDKITDELLVVASDVATSAAASADESVSGKARLRMLAWLVADARGAAEFRQALVGVRPPPIRAVLAARPGSVAAGSFSRLGAGGAETE